ncbi:ATP-binding protein [Xanthomonas arboricola]|uniref:ATP-binding protein n=1 Tax=Xanthomonas arboricola TaxID=56448 RepID=UPI000E1EE4AD|nr:ATP-binding protein [Xanthomonas arboricola]
MHSSAEVFHLSDLPDPQDEQFRMRQLSVLNWGTFTGLHRMPVSPEGTLIIGPSGAGKSTLLDAISALTVSPRTVRFNAAADESGKRDPDRTLMSYVRGAWAERADDQSARSLAKQYLRTNATWTAVALEYANALGRVMSIVRVLWVRGAGSNAKVESHFLVVDAPFDLSEIGEFTGERKALTKRFSDPPYRSHESFTAFSEHWCRVVGIVEPNALNLLHQTQSTKNLSDLNGFLRDYMLAEPKTFEIADSLVSEFVDLDEAHRAVVVAREQIDVLAPSRDAYRDREVAEGRVQHVRSLIVSLPQFQAQETARLLRDEDVRLESVISTTRIEAEEAHRHQHALSEALENLRRAADAGGGGDLAQLEAARGQLLLDKERVERRRTSAGGWAGALGLTLADDQATFAAQLLAARSEQARAEERLAGAEGERDTLLVDESRLREELSLLRKEIETLEGSTSSIPRDKQEIRAWMCRDLGIPKSRVPFAGELISVKPEHKDWEGAANRLLGGFGTSLLVDVNDYRQVAAWVDKNHLRSRWSYYQVEPTPSTGNRDRRPGLLLNCLDVSESPYRQWVWKELWHQADFECVEKASDLMKGQRRITRAGQIRFSGGLHQKDDRFRVDDESRWVLGDNRAKLDRLKRNAADTAGALAKISQRRSEAVQSADGIRLRAQAAAHLVEVEWPSIDLTGALRRIEENQEAQRALLERTPGLIDLQGQLVQKQDEAKRALADAPRLTLDIEALERQRAENAGELEAASIRALGLPPEADAGLTARCGPWTPTLKTIHGELARVREVLDREKDVLSEAISAHVQSILQCFQTFLHRWPEERGSLQPNLPSATDFFAKLERLETDGLPKHEARFQELLRKQSMQRLAELSQHLHEARSEIENGMDDVNRALRPVPYNPDTYLYIRTEDRGLDEPREFRRRLGTLFAQRGELTEETAEAQFEGLRRLIQDLRADDAAGRQWRDLVLDVRKHVEFIADECDRISGVVVENYGGAGGKSGGQRQKLTATCLAAALRFKLGGSDGGVPSYAAVVLDEAFTKTDNEFTATCMRIFTGMGFQMIVATPMKSVMTLEEFVGGATYVSIKDRKVSSLLHIAYDADQRRLRLPEGARRGMELAE